MGKLKFDCVKGYMDRCKSQMLEVQRQVTVNAASSSSSSVAGTTVKMTEPKMVRHQTTEKLLIKVKKEKTI